MSVDRGHEAEAHGSADGLGDLALVDRSKTSLVAVLDTAQGRDIFGHDGEVLFKGRPVSGQFHFAIADGLSRSCQWADRAKSQAATFDSSTIDIKERVERRESAHLVEVHWVQVQRIKCIPGRTLALSPFLHFGRAEIVWGVNITSLPLASLEFLQSTALALCLLIFNKSHAVR